MCYFLLWKSNRKVKLLIVLGKADKECLRSGHRNRYSAFFSRKHGGHLSCSVASKIVKNNTVFFSNKSNRLFILCDDCWLNIIISLITTFIRCENSFFSRCRRKPFSRD